MAKTANFNPTEHALVPAHEKINDKEIKEILDRYDITLDCLPRITINDAAIAHLKVKEGDVIKITRPSQTAGETIFYRCVING